MAGAGGRSKMPASSASVRAASRRGKSRRPQCAARARQRGSRDFDNADRTHGLVDGARQEIGELSCKVDIPINEQAKEPIQPKHDHRTNQCGRRNCRSQQTPAPPVSTPARNPLGQSNETWRFARRRAAGRDARAAIASPAHGERRATRAGPGRLRPPGSSGRVTAAGRQSPWSSPAWPMARLSGSSTAPGLRLVNSAAAR